MGHRIYKNNFRTIISDTMSSVMDEHGVEDSRTDLDLYDNMVVVGKHATIFSDTGNKVYVCVCVCSGLWTV